MSVLTDLVAQLEKEVAKEEALLDGYNLLSISAELSPTAKIEVGEGFSYSSMRREFLMSAKIALTNLINHGYPQRQMQSASAEVIKELQDLLNATEQAVNEFVQPVEVVLTVSEEIPI